MENYVGHRNNLNKDLLLLLGGSFLFYIKEMKCLGMRLCSLCSGHDWGTGDLQRRFPRDDELLSDNLVYVVVVVQSLSHVQLFATPWSEA